MDRLVGLGLAAGMALAKKMVSASGVCTAAAAGNPVFGCRRGLGGVPGLSRACGKGFGLCQYRSLLMTSNISSSEGGLLGKLRSELPSPNLPVLGG